jgi:hypothetical protein
MAKSFYPKDQKKGTNYKRRPKGLATLKRMYPTVMKRGQFRKMEPKMARAVVQNVVSLIPPESLIKRGEGTHFLFPLASAKVGEFVKGVLKVKAPYAKVTFLVVPPMMNFASGARPLEAMKNLRRNLNKCLDVNDKHVVVIDKVWEGKTMHAIRDALDAVRTNDSSLRFSVNTHGHKDTILPLFTSLNRRVAAPAKNTPPLYANLQKQTQPERNQTNFYRRYFQNLGIAAAEEESKAF